MTKREQYDVIRRAFEGGAFSDVRLGWSQAHRGKEADEKRPPTAALAFARTVIERVENILGERAIERLSMFTWVYWDFSSRVDGDRESGWWTTPYYDGLSKLFGEMP